jgi:peptidoglycan/LPS O-acetylase OafA/YrhL
MVGTFRLILALMVLGSHLFEAWQQYPDPGLIAVVTFFFISGFLMPATFDANYRFRAFATQTMMFYWARFLRIYPMYWIALFIGMAIVPLITGVPNWYDGGLLHAGIQNFVLLGLNQASFWSSETRIVNVAWTLDIELQFYLLVPLFVLLRRSSPAALYSVFAAITFYSVWRLAHPVGITGIDRTFLAYGIYFCAGFTCYLHRETLQRRAHHLVFSGIAIALVISIATWQTLVGPASAWPLSAVFVGIAALCLLGRAPTLRCDKYLGDLSYPVFLFHNFIRQYAVPDALMHHPWLALLYSAGLSIAFSAFVERLISPTINRIRDRAKMRETPPEADVKWRRLVRPDLKSGV